MSTFLKFLLVYYFIINAVLFLLMALDKARAQKQKWRIPEATLFVVALLGGGIGGFLGMRACRHKTRKPAFYLIFGISLILHLAFVYLVLTLKL